MVTFVRNPAGFNAVFNSKTGPVGRHLSERARLLQTLAVSQVGKRTGRLAQSIGVSVRRDTRGLVWRVGSDNRIALLHHQGTRPHLITPDRARVLRFSSRGRVVYARVVHHPGTRPNRYLTDNLRRIF